MFILDFFRYFRGYVRIEISGDYAERFINLCAKNHISVWNIARNGNGLSLCMSIKNFKQIKSLRKQIKYKISVRLKEKTGFPFVLYRYRDRKGLAAGFLLFFAILYIMSRFIWTVEVTGNEALEAEEIISVCEELGVREGILRSSVDAYNLRQSLILSMDGIAWCSFNVEGSKLTVDISEAKDTAKENDKTPCNLIAAYDGVIKSAEVSVGTSAVKTGQAVRKGDLLVSGAVTVGDRSEFVKAEGVITARTTREFRAEVPLEKTVRKANGTVVYRSVLHAFGLDLPLFLGDIRFPYESKYFEKNFSMFGGRLPIKVMTREFKAITEEKLMLTEEEAKNEALAAVAEQVRQLPITELDVQSTDAVVNDGNLELTVIAVCTEDICAEQKIMINNGN